MSELNPEGLFEENAADNSSAENRKVTAGKRKRQWNSRKGDKIGNNGETKFKRPTHFFAVEITVPKIKGVMSAVQDCMVSQQKLLSHALVDIDKAHITLGLLHSPDQATVAEAVNRLESCKNELDNIIRDVDFELKVSGIGNFGRKVVFAKVLEDENEEKLKEISKLLCEKFDDLKSSSIFEYKAHVTLFKLSKIRNGRIKKKLRNIDINTFQPFNCVSFGTQPVKTVQLLGMFTTPQSGGYYHCECEVAIGLHEPEQIVDIDDESDYAEYLSSYSVASGLCDVMLANSKRNQAENVS